MIRCIFTEALVLVLLNKIDSDLCMCATKNDGPGGLVSCPKPPSDKDKTKRKKDTQSRGKKTPKKQPPPKKTTAKGVSPCFFFTAAIQKEPHLLHTAETHARRTDRTANLEHVKRK